VADGSDPGRGDGDGVEAGIGRRPRWSAPAGVDAVSLGGALRGARLAIALALIAAVGINAILVRQTGRAVDDLAEREFALVREARILEGEAPEIIGDGRGYLLSLDPRFVRAFEQNRIGARDALGRLRERVVTAAGRRLVEAIDVHLEAVIAGVQRSIELAQAGQVEAAREESVAATATQGELFAQLDALVEREETLLRDRLDELQAQRLLGLVGSGALLLIVGVLAGLLLRRSERALDASQSGLRRAAAELSTINATLAAANRALRDAAETRDRALLDLRRAIGQREEFLASISHDLKNPLAAIKGQAQLLERRVRRSAAVDPDAAVGSLAAGLAGIGASVSRMAALIDQLLDVARIDLGQPLPLDRRPTDLVDLARKAVVDEQRSTERHRVRLEAVVPTLVAWVDAARIERVLANLLSNAVKYSPSGGEIAVVIDREARTDGADAVVAVRDEGVGIPAADVPRLFERFHRGENVAGRFAGTGLGLAGARHIVEGHGGTIAVASEEGAGTTFTVRLPLGEPAADGGGPMAESGRMGHR